MTEKELNTMRAELSLLMANYNLARHHATNAKHTTDIGIGLTGFTALLAGKHMLEQEAWLNFGILAALVGISAYFCGKFVWYRWRDRNKAKDIDAAAKNFLQFVLDTDAKGDDRFMALQEMAWTEMQRITEGINKWTS